MMAKPSVVSKIVSWAFGGANRAPASGSGPTTGPRKLPKGFEPGPSGSVGSVADQIQPNTEQKSFGEIVRMMNCDYQVKFANFVIGANVAAVQVSISVEDGDGQKSALLADKLQKLWERSVPAMMDSIGFGRVAFEKSFDFDPAGPVTFIDKLEAIEFEDSSLRLTADHQFDGFDVRVKRNPDQWLPVEPWAAWWLALDATAKNPHGISKYKGAVEQAWKTKVKSMDNREMYVRRFAIRGGVARGPETFTDERTGRVYDGAEMMGEAAQNLYSGGQMFLPNTPHSDTRLADKGEYEWKFEEANVTALDPAPILNVIDKDDVAILRAFGIPEKTAIEGDAVGSFAMISEQILTLFAVVDAIVAQWVASFQRYVVDQSRELNYGDGPGPKFTVHAVKLTNRPDSFVIQLLTSLAANPQFATLILSGAVDLRSILESVGLPVAAGFEQVAQQVAARFMALQGAMGGAAGPVPGQAPADGSQGSGPGAEFAGAGRRQLSNNLKATEDALNDFKTGAKSEAYTQTLLESYGWSPERAKALIDDARDGTIDDPQFAGAPVAMRNLLSCQQAIFRAALADVVKKK